MKAFVLGYGNVSRQDDGAGHLLAGLVARIIRKSGAEVELWKGHQLVPEVLLDVKGYQVLFFCDASLKPYPEGFLIEKVNPGVMKTEGLNMHTFGPANVLSLAEQLTGEVPDAWLISVTGESFDFSHRLTPQCKTRIKSAARAFRSFWKHLSEGL